MKRLMIASALALWSLPLLAAPGHEYAFGKPAAAAQATRTVEVVMGDMYFEPRALQVKAGETVRFVLVNNGQVPHEFNLGMRPCTPGTSRRCSPCRGRWIIRQWDMAA